MKSSEKGSKPRGIWIWLLTILACLLALFLAVLAYCMAVPVRFNGLGGFAATYAFLYPLHVLLLTVLASVMAYVASRSRVRFAVWVFGLVAILTMILGLIPTLVIWGRVSELNVPVSLGNYLANAGHMNHGLPQADRSVVYGTARDGTKLELDV